MNSGKYLKDSRFTGVFNLNLNSYRFDCDLRN